MYRSSGECRQRTCGSPSPRCALRPQKSEFPLFPKPRQGGSAHARARACAESDFSTIPYTPRMREQHCASGGKAVKLGLANMLQVGPTRYSALPCIRGQRTDPGRSAGIQQRWSRSYSDTQAANNALGISARRDRGLPGSNERDDDRVVMRCYQTEVGGGLVY
jgi:hypothetical protein